MNAIIYQEPSSRRLAEEGNEVDNRVWLITQNELLVAGRCGNPGPMCLGLGRREVAQLGQIQGRLVKADQRFGRLQAISLHIVRAQHADDPGWLTQEDRHDAAESSGGGITRDALVDDLDLIARTPQVKEMTEDFRPGLEVVGDAVAERDNRAPGREGELIDAGGEVRIAEKLFSRLSRRPGELGAPQSRCKCRP